MWPSTGGRPATSELALELIVQQSPLFSGWPTLHASGVQAWQLSLGITCTSAGKAGIEALHTADTGYHLCPQYWSLQLPAALHKVFTSRSFCQLRQLLEASVEM